MKTLYYPSLLLLALISNLTVAAELSPPPLPEMQADLPPQVIKQPNDIELDYTTDELLGITPTLKTHYPTAFDKNSAEPTSPNKRPTVLDLQPETPAPAPNSLMGVALNNEQVAQDKLQALRDKNRAILTKNGVKPTPIPRLMQQAPAMQSPSLKATTKKIPIFTAAQHQTKQPSQLTIAPQPTELAVTNNTDNLTRTDPKKIVPTPKADLPKTDITKAVLVSKKIISKKEPVSNTPKMTITPNVIEDKPTALAQELIAAEKHADSLIDPSITGGFDGPFEGVKTVDAILELSMFGDGVPVVLTGNLVASRGNDFYIFKDETNSIPVEIKSNRWLGISATPQTTIEIHGLVNKEFPQTYVEVKKINVVNTSKS